MSFSQMRDQSATNNTARHVAHVRDGAPLATTFVRDKIEILSYFCNRARRAPAGKDLLIDPTGSHSVCNSSFVPRATVCPPHAQHQAQQCERTHHTPTRPGQRQLYHQLDLWLAVAAPLHERNSFASG
jgi:hypothetical protein